MANAAIEVERQAKRGEWWSLWLLGCEGYRCCGSACGSRCSCSNAVQDSTEHTDTCEAERDLADSVFSEFATASRTRQATPWQTDNSARGVSSSRDPASLLKESQSQRMSKSLCRGSSVSPSQLGTVFEDCSSEGSSIGEIWTQLNSPDGGAPDQTSVCAYIADASPFLALTAQEEDGRNYVSIEFKSCDREAAAKVSPDECAEVADNSERRRKEDWRPENLACERRALAELEAEMERLREDLKDSQLASRDDMERSPQRCLLSGVRPLQTRLGRSLFNQGS